MPHTEVELRQLARRNVKLQFDSKVPILLDLGCLYVDHNVYHDSRTHVAFSLDGIFIVLDADLSWQWMRRRIRMFSQIGTSIYDMERVQMASSTRCPSSPTSQSLYPCQYNI